MSLPLDQVRWMWDVKFVFLLEFISMPVARRLFKDTCCDALYPRSAMIPLRSLYWVCHTVTKAIKISGDRRVKMLSNRLL